MWPEAKHKWQSLETFTISHRSSGVFLANKSQFIRRCLPLQQGQVLKLRGFSLMWRCDLTEAS